MEKTLEFLTSGLRALGDRQNIPRLPTFKMHQNASPNMNEHILQGGTLSIPWPYPMRKMIFRQCQGPASPLRSAATKRFSKELLLGTERVTLVAM